MGKNNNKHEFVIKIEGEEWENAQDKAFVKRNKNAKIDGFRPGKAPKDVFIKHYGKESLYFDAADSLIMDAYTKVLERENVVPVVEPKIDVKSIDETGVEFVFTIITNPEIEIKKYKDLGVKKESAVVTEEEVEHEISHLLEHYTELETKESGVVENGNVVIIDFEGFKDGVAFEGGKAENYSLEIGSGAFIPGFEEQLIGMEKDSEKEITVTFPEDYGSEELKGAEAVFKIKLHEIKEKVARELNEEFFEDLAMPGVNSKESLEKEIKARLTVTKEHEVENKFVDAVLDKIASNTEVDIPEEMVNEEVERLIHAFEHRLQSQGISLDLYFEFTKSNHEMLHEQFEKEAYQNVLYRLIIEKLIEVENIEVTKEEGENEVKELATKFETTEEEILKEYHGLDMVMYDLKVRKLFKKLEEYNK